MTVLAMLFMIISVSFVTSFTIWCYYRVLFKVDRKQEKAGDTNNLIT